MINFFVNWELWQQMTFVLASAIVIVFCAGLIKLWWLSRYLKKHAVLDLEKRARQTEMQKTGLPIIKRSEIPFGVRAIQSGIQVDGIWISRPGSLVEVSQGSPSISSSSTLEPKGKEREISLRLSTAVTEVQPTPDFTPRPSPPVSLSDKYVPTGIEPGPGKAYPPGAQPAYRPLGPSRRRTDISAAETSDIDIPSQPERNSPRHLQVETYVPTTLISSSESSTSSSSHQRTVAERSSSSSDEGNSQLRYVDNLRRSAAPSSRALVSFDDSEPLDYDAQYFLSNFGDQTGNPFEAPSPPESQWVSRPPLAANKPTPRRTYSGESHANTSSRIINPGFEILPAGTFGLPESPTELEDGRPKRYSGNKLQKKNRSSREGLPTR